MAGRAVSYAPEYLLWPYPLHVAGIVDEINKRGGKRLDETGASIAIRCLFSKGFETEHLGSFRESLLGYDIPIGQSPKVQSDSLRSLIETGKKMCLAPPLFGSTAGITQLGQADYIAALKSTGTGAAMTLILISTRSLGSILIRKVAENRQRRTKANSSERGTAVTPPPIVEGEESTKAKGRRNKRGSE